MKTFSKRSSKFIKEKDVKWFNGLAKMEKGLRLGSLIDKAKEDNLNEYKLLKKEYINDNVYLVKKNSTEVRNP